MFQRFFTMANDLYAFSLRHFTYINQIFGDQTVREIISEVYPNASFVFNVKVINKQGDFHHTLLCKKNKKTKEWCSVNEGYQNMEINVNDTLCQSYTLLHYLGFMLYFDSFESQMEMIKMYRWLLENSSFITALDDVIHSENNHLWKNYSTKKKYVKMDKEEILSSINSVLDEWEEYGYRYFIGNGL